MPTEFSGGANRRRFLQGATAGALVAPVMLRTAAAAAAPTTAWNQAIIVNALGSLDNPNARGEQSKETRPRQRLDARSLGDAHASGVTAINVTLGYTGGRDDPYELTISDIALGERMIRDQSNDLLKVLTASDILRAKRERKLGIIYGFQNTAMIGDRLDRIDIFADLGVRVIQLTYNPANQVGDGSSAKENRGLTPFGREVVGRLNENRVMVDLSHSGENTCLDAIRISKQPVSINHTGCRALVDLPRNKTDAELRQVAEKGGFVGIYFMPFLNREGKVRADDIVAHIAHAIEVCGEDHVGIGTDGSITSIDDLDGYRAALAKEVEARKQAGIAAAGEGPDTLPFAIDLRGVNQFYDLADRLQKRGYTATRVEKILGGNFVRYAKEVWGA